MHRFAVAALLAALLAGPGFGQDSEIETRLLPVRIVADLFAGDLSSFRAFLEDADVNPSSLTYQDEAIFGDEVWLSFFVGSLAVTDLDGRPIGDFSRLSRSRARRIGIRNWRVASALYGAGLDPNRSVTLGITIEPVGAAFLALAQHFQPGDEPESAVTAVLEILFPLLEATARRGADFADATTSYVAFVMATGLGNRDLVEYLVQAGADPALRIEGAQVGLRDTVAGFLIRELYSGFRPYEGMVYSEDLIRDYLALPGVAQLLAGSPLPDPEESPALTDLGVLTVLGFAREIEALIEAGVDPGGVHSLNEDYGVLHLAVRSGRIDIARMLLEAGAPHHAVGESSVTALHVAAALPDGEAAEEQARLLLDAGASLSARNADGLNAYEVSLASANEAVARLLKTRGAVLRPPVLFDLPYRGPAQPVEVLELLAQLEAETLAGAVDSSGNTLLHLFAGLGAGAVDALVSAGLDPSARDGLGRTPLARLAGRIGAAPVSPDDVYGAAERLIAAGADPAAADHEGFGVLTYAAHGGGAPPASLLLSRADHHADELARALVVAVAAGRTELVSLLLQAGAEPDREVTLTRLSGESLEAYRRTTARALAEEMPSLPASLRLSLGLADSDAPVFVPRIPHRAVRPPSGPP